MRKLFTQLFSMLMLICVFGFQVSTFAATSWDGENSIPMDGDINVNPADIATQFVVAFEDVPSITAAGGTMVVYKEGVLLKTIPITNSSSAVQIVDKTIVVTHGMTTIEDETDYSILITAGTVTVGEDEDPVSIAPDEWSFTVGDFTPPMLVDEDPLVPVGEGVEANIFGDDFELTMVFDEPVAFGEGTIAIYLENGTVVELIDVEDLTSDLIDGAEVTIPVSNEARFVGEANYYVRVMPGAIVDVVDEYGEDAVPNAYAGITDNTSWTFSTRINMAPVITANVSGITGTSAELNVTLDADGAFYYLAQDESFPAPTDLTNFTKVEDVEAGVEESVTIDAQWNAAPLMGENDYEIYIVSENDEVPSDISGVTDFKLVFTTLDNTAPVADYTDSDIPDVVNDDGITTGAIIYFNEEVIAGAGTLAVRKMENNALVATVAASEVTSTQVMEGDDDEDWAPWWRVVFDFGVELESDVEYYIVFPNGFITDLAGNEYADPVDAGDDVPDDKGEWVIQSADFEAPVVTFSTTTKDVETIANIVDAGNDDVFYINFDEDVVPATLYGDWDDLNTYSTYDMAAWSEYVTLEVDGILQRIYCEYDEGDNVIEVQLMKMGSQVYSSEIVPFESNTTYTLTLKGNVLEDESGNVIEDVNSITITTGDNDEPTYEVGSTDDLEATTTLTIEFSKDVFVADGDGEIDHALDTDDLEDILTLEVDEDGAGFDAVDAADYTAVFDPATMTITVTYSEDWPTSVCDDYTAQVRLSIDNTDLIDSKEAAFIGADDYTWNVEDYEAPVVTLLSGDVELSDMNTDNALVVFSEPVYLVGDYDPDTYDLEVFTLKEGSADGKNLSFEVSPEGDGNDEYTLTPVADGDWSWEIGKTYYYGIGRVVEDCASNVNAATYSTFTVIADAVPPAVEALTYTVNGGSAIDIDDAAEDVEVNDDGDVVVAVTFNMNIDDKDLTAINTVATTFVDGTAALIDVEIVSDDIDGTVLTITIPDPVIPDPSTEYTVTIPAGLVEANASNGGVFPQLGDDVVITINTADLEAPSITGGIPADLATVELDLDEGEMTINFSEAVELGSGAITFTADGETTAEQSITVGAANIEMGDDGLSAVVSVDPLELYGTDYTVDVPEEAFEDAAGNDLDMDYSWTYTTVANPAPMVAEDGLSPADGSDLVPLTGDLQITFTEDVKIFGVASRKQVIVIEKVGDADATLNVDGDLEFSETGDDQDVRVYYTYVEDDDNVKIDGNLVTIKNVVLEEDKEYYVLITPGAFVDLSLPTAGEYAGISAYDGDVGDGWDFQTGDVVNAEAELEFSDLGLDGLPTIESDIKVVFTKPVVKVGGDDITDEEVANLLTLYKNVEGTWEEIDFTGTISADKMTITIDNSSLVILGEMVGSTEYKVRFEANVLESEGNETPLAEWEEAFTTSDYEAPAAPAIVFDGDEVDAISYGENDDEEMVHMANLVISDAADNDAVKLYYFWTADLETEFTEMSVEDFGEVLTIGTDADDDLVSGGSYDLYFDENMENETEYRLVSVAEDAAGNMSEVTEFTYITDDVIAPELAGDLPTSFSTDEELQITFNEDVVPAADAFARIIDENGVAYEAPLANLSGDDVEEADSVITIVISAAGLPLSDDVATYTVEIDGDMIYDVPRLTEDDVDANEPNAYEGLFGSTFAVTTDDETAPLLESFTVDALEGKDPVPSENWCNGEFMDSDDNFVFVPLNPTFTLTFNEAVELNDNFVSFVIYEFDNDCLDWWENIHYNEGDDDLVKSALAINDPYDVLTADNISGDGTSTLTITTNRALQTSKTYYIVIEDGTFDDLEGNVWEEGENLYINMIGEDVDPLYVSFRAPVYNDETGNTEMFYLPYDGELPYVPQGESHDNHNFQIKFRKSNGLSGFDGESKCEDYPEGFRIHPDQPVIDLTELKEHVYVKVDGEDVPFAISIGRYNCPYANAIKFGLPDIEDYRGKTITYGFINLYDNHGNLNEGEEVSFVIAADAQIYSPVTFTPGDNDGDDDTKVTIGVDQIFTITFDGIIYSYSENDADNNLIMSLELLEELEPFELEQKTDADGNHIDEQIDIELLSYSEESGKSVVTLQAVDSLESEIVYQLDIDWEYSDNPDHIQIGQGNDRLDYYDETYVTADVDAPKLIADEDGETLDEAYLPAKEGVVGKSETLALVFDEEVEGAGSVVIHRWDGAIVATVDITGIGSEEADDNEWVIEIGDVEDIMDANTDFVTNQSYYVIVPDTSIIDMAETPNAFAGITTINEWSFDLRDDTTPVPTFVQNEEMGLPVNTTIDITFDREVVTNYGWLAIYEEEDGDAVELIRIEDDIAFASNTAFSFNVEGLVPDTKYYVELGEGSFVLNADGVTEQEQVEIGEWWFSTETDQAPTPVMFSPANEPTLSYSVVPGQDLVIKFDMAVAPGTGNIQLHNLMTTGDNIISAFDVTDPTQVVFTDSTVTIPGDVLGLLENEAYYIIIPGTAISNTSTTPEFWEGITTPLEWQFGTGLTPVFPELVEWTPLEDTIADNHPTFVMTFADDIMLAMDSVGYLTVTEMDSTEATLEIEITAEMIAGNVVTVTYEYDSLVGGLKTNTTYVVNVDGGILENEQGNTFDGVSGTEAWTFTTGEDWATSIEPEFEAVDFNIYPNPFNDHITITNSDKVARMIVVNIAGQRVMDVEYPNQEIYTGNMVSGVYVISLITENGQRAKTMRMIKR